MNHMPENLPHQLDDGIHEGFFEFDPKNIPECPEDPEYVPEPPPEEYFREIEENERLRDEIFVLNAEYIRNPSENG